MTYSSFFARFGLSLVFIMTAGVAMAQNGLGNTLSGLPAFTVVDSSNGATTYSLSLQILMLMTALTLLPSLVLGMTSFTRVIIVLSILRQALGTQQTPPNQVLIHRYWGAGHRPTHQTRQ